MLATTITAVPEAGDLLASLLLGFLAAVLAPPLVHDLVADHPRRRRAWSAALLALAVLAAFASLLLGLRWNVSAHYTDPAARLSVIQGVTYSATIAAGLFIGLARENRPGPR